MLKNISRSLFVALLIFTFSLPALAGRELFKSNGQKVYVPVYSHIYQGLKGKPYNLSALVSIRNIDTMHSLVITRGDYYDDHGDLVRSYVKKPLVVPPLGTQEIYIPERDTKGGSGANFIIRWKSEKQIPIPIIQAVMIGTASTQGISFVCDGVVIKED